MTARPLRIALALALASLVLALLATLLAFVVAGAALTSGQAVWGTVVRAFLGSLGSFLAFAFTFGALARLALAATGREGAGAHALAGGIAGVIFGAATALIAPAAGPAWAFAAFLPTMAVVGAAMLLLTRRLARAFGATGGTGEAAQ